MMKFSVKTKLAVLVLAIITLFGALLGWLLVEREVDLLTRELRLRGGAIARGLANSAELAVLVGDAVEAERLLAGVMLENDIVYAEISTANDKTLASLGAEVHVAGVEEIGVTIFGSGSATASSQQQTLIGGLLPEQGNVAGFVHVHISQKEMWDQIRILRQMVALLLGGMMLFSSLVAFLGIRKLVSKPLQHLLEGIEHLRQGDLNWQITIESKDEMSLLADAFNRMSDDLSSTLVSKNFFDGIITCMAEAMLVIDTNCCIIDANPAALKLLGFTRDQLRKCHLSEILVSLEDNFLEEYHGTEQLYQMANGKHVPVLYTSTYLYDKNADLTGMVCVARDITELKLAELENSKAREKLERYAEDLEEANEDMKSFAYIVSHDLRAPLVNIKGFSAELKMSLQELSELATDESVGWQEQQKREVGMLIDEDIPESLDFIEKSVSRMDTLINSVLQLSRMGRRELLPEQVNLNELVQAIVGSIQHQIESRNVQVSISPLPELYIDKMMAEQVFGNLLDNATKYLSDERAGKIELTYRESDRGVLFSVRDNGRGIATEDLDKVFKIFRRAGQQTVKGEGMGLAYVKTLLKRVHGHIWCESELNVGTVFHVALPKIFLEPPVETEQPEQTEEAG